MLENKKQIISPKIVGSRNAIKVHFMLFVSFFIVISVVEQGQCIKKKSMVDIAVIKVHPFVTNRFLINVRSLISTKFPFAIYPIIIRGITISLAGKPNINAIRITPSRPKSLANGSKN